MGLAGDAQPSAAALGAPRRCAIARAVGERDYLRPVTGLLLEADLLAAAAARKLHIVGLHFGAPGELRGAEGRLDGASHLARRHRGELVQRRRARRFREALAPVVAVADLA